LNLRFRPAEPRDANLAVPLIYSAGPEGFEYVFTQGRRSARDFLGHAFTDGAGLFGCRNHRVVKAWPNATAAWSASARSTAAPTMPR
jgi:hypothetical protein